MINILLKNNMKDIPKSFYRYKQMPIWNQNTIPQMFLDIHNTKAGVYGRINVLSGKLKYTIFRDKNGEIEDTYLIEAGNFGIAKPEQWHKVEAIGEVEILLEFFKEKPKEIQESEEKFEKIFPDKSPHYEVKYLASLVENKKGKKALDLGSGGGRNSLYLAMQGFKVTSWDKNLDGLFSTSNLAKKNFLDIKTSMKNLNKELVEENFDVIIATVSLQFLEKESAIKLLNSAVKHTNIGGYNLIIVPIESENFSCPINFPNLMTYKDYLDMYKNWEIIYSDDMIGKFHKTNEKGIRIMSRFATIIAKKV
ncbi:hypothetical protein DLH72_00660 [Candidatus Gracilibacteria bacterium]|nr:MAG: hypothetical protein DLH72_00660 [Candidatus Gracilibacteria bacterium]